MLKTITKIASVLLLAPTAAFAQAMDCSGNPYPVVALSEGLELIEFASGNLLGTSDFLQVFEAGKSYDHATNIVEVIMDGKIVHLPRDQMAVFVPSNDCRTSAVTMDDLAEIDSRWEGNPLFAKAIARVTLEGVQRDRDAGLDSSEINRGISIKAAPDSEARELATIGLFTFVNIQNVHLDNDSNIWYFVGTSPSIKFYTNNDGGLTTSTRRTFSGWVRAQDLVLLSQREAAYPRDSSNTTLYTDNNMTTPWDGFNFAGDALPARSQAVAKAPLIENVNGVLRLVMTLARSSQASAQQPSASVVGAESSDLRALLGRWVDGDGSIDALFVLDNTESMTDYHNAILEGVTEAAQSNTFSRKLRVAFAMFGDNFGSKAKYDAFFSTRGASRNMFTEPWSAATRFGAPVQFHLLDFGRTGAVPSPADLSSYFGGYYHDSNNDRPEAGLSALYTAISGAGWRDYTKTLRLVFYMGDDRARIAPNQALANLLRENHIVLIPISLAGKYPNDQENREWVTQMQTLRDLTSTVRGQAGGVIGPQLTYAPGDLNRNETSSIDTAATVAKVMEVINVEFHIMDILRGAEPLPEKLSTILTEQNLPGGEITADLIESQFGATSDEMLALFQSVDSISELYFLEESAQTYVALTGSEFESLKSGMTTACRGFNDTNAIKYELEQMTNQIAQAFLGDSRYASPQSGDESIAEFFHRTIYLPIEYFSIFGDMRIDDFRTFVNRDENKSAMLAVRAEICMSSFLLRQIADSNYVERSQVRVLNRDVIGISPEYEVVGDQKAFNWLWSDETAQYLYFVPKSFFPSLQYLDPKSRRAVMNGLQ